MKKNNLFKSKAFSITIGIVNTFLILGLIFYLINVNIRTEKTYGKNVSVDSRFYTEQEADDAVAQAEDTMTDTYALLLGGSYGEIGDYYMNFGTDGSYKGFYDSNNTEISGYTYDVAQKSVSDGNDVVANVNIYNSDSTSYVQYKLKFDSGYNLQLYYPESGVTVQLQ